MADNNASEDDSEITVTREREIVQKESVVVKSKRGTGTNDRDEIRKEVVREATLDIPEGLIDQFPSLVGETQMASMVGDVSGTMADLRETNNGSDE